MQNLLFNKLFKENQEKYIKLTLDENDLARIQEIINIVIPAKQGEYHHKIDGRQEEKRWSTGFAGEIAVEKLLDYKFIAYGVGHSNEYNRPDIEGIKVGIKTVEYGKFPVIFKKSYYPEIICIRQENDIYVCGVALPQILNSYQSDEYILSPALRARGTKTAFIGLDKLIQFSTMEELKRILKK